MERDRLSLGAEPVRILVCGLFNNSFKKYPNTAQNRHIALGFPSIYCELKANNSFFMLCIGDIHTKLQIKLRASFKTNKKVMVIQQKSNCCERGRIIT